VGPYCVRASICRWSYEAVGVEGGRLGSRSGGNDLGGLLGVVYARACPMGGG
jgi:hypothetical protein